MSDDIQNLYVHFPFCRRKCTYCALHSRAGRTDDDRCAYVTRLVESVTALGRDKINALQTIYFGGGSPALCDLKPLLDVLKPALNPACEFTVELHPLDVTTRLLQTLQDGGVNRISMGVQSLDDETLRHMGRGYTFTDAESAFALIKMYFENAGIDLIVGYPTPGDCPRDNSRGDCPRERAKVLSPRWARLAQWDLTHCSVYSLILEENSILAKRLGTVPTSKYEGTVPNVTKPEGTAPGLILPSDEETLNQIAIISRFLENIGLNRYEISNYARPGFECRHNLATWRGEDYYGLGDGAHGRLGLTRTQNWWGQSPIMPTQGCVAPQLWGQSPASETLTPEADRLERTIFQLRTREGLDATAYPHWIPLLDDYAQNGLVTRLSDDQPIYRLTERGTEVCDSILADLI